MARLGRGTVAVIAADTHDAGRPRRSSAQLHTPVSAKGLEFDAVVIVDPERIRAHNPADLYVSMTRATQRLILVGGQSSSASIRAAAAAPSVSTGKR